MKHLYWILSFLAIGSLQAQQKIDTTAITQAARLIGLSFTPAEKDSMADGLNDNLQHYRKMHQLSIPNSLPYPFAFNPAPYGLVVPTKQASIKWNIPVHIKLPVNRNELAFYSVMQLASLIKYKKISSVELTTFFWTGLKNGDTLECVITLTPELALEQARAADEALKRYL
ncbi:hypothetical protein [Paraflavitalea speifideaquila]|uniref:hypothetical protein n=1 Tax=Paraflavitalea speifideaquila TaxID=3076558 RepID=UPI0028F0CA56|nr:hypothetical protein [Paraflavitalea speifideiaquila]